MKWVDLCCGVNLRRRELQAFFEKQPPVEVVLEACGGSHHWGRWLMSLGHRVRLIPAQYVKPFVKRGKNDRNDAEAISVAASQPSIGSVAVKSAETQARAMLLSVRELLVRQRTQLVNALRGHAAEFGLVAPLGGKALTCLRSELASVAEEKLPAEAKQALTLLGREVDRIEARLAEVDAKLMVQHKADPLSQRLTGIPGVGPIGALNFASRVDPAQFKSGRHFAAWLGRCRRSGRPVASSVSAASAAPAMSGYGNFWCWVPRRCIRHAKPGRPNGSAWLLELLKRRPRKLVAVALANKMARILWAMMTSWRSVPATRPAAA